MRISHFTEKELGNLFNGVVSSKRLFPASYGTRDSQIISQTAQADEYTIMGAKDDYTYTVCVTKNSEQDKELKDYPTSLAISLVPAPEGMAESLKEMSGNMPGGKK
ncbi:MAG: hypothetical protein HPY66_1509 [Firmicutes bacterium]|nr:hypothetical protein [Bacillota bacterium]